MKPTTLCIFAHPDDESWVCGGSIARASTEGQRVVLALLTRGENCRAVREGRYTPAAMIKIRRAEMARGARLLGISTVRYAHYPDGGLRRVPAPQLDRTIRRLLTQYRPTTVFSFARDGFSGHSDHRTVAAAVIRTLMRLPLPQRRTVTLVQFSLPNSLRTLLGLPRYRYRRLGRLDVRPYARRRESAIRAHRSQTATVRRLEQLPRREQRRLLSYEYRLA